MPASRLSLVLAITGHRDLYPEDFQGFEDEIRGIFTELRRDYPHTPLLLLSGLAEGADRIAVRAAIKESVDYIAVFPKDFATAKSQIEFDRLRTGAVRVIELPVCDGDEYERLGEFLVKYSQILIAVWDKRRTGKKGGTGDVVAMKLGEKASGRMALARMNNKGAGPVYELAARRMSVPLHAAPALNRHLTYPERTKPEDFEASYKLQDQFNADVADAGRYFEKAVEQSRKYLLEGEAATDLSEAMDWVATIYSQADALAIHFSKLSMLLWRAVFGLLALGGVILAWQHIWGGGLPLLSAYWACIGMASGLGVWEVRGKRRERHENYRALAEALRVQFFWMAAGLPDITAEQYLRKQVPEMVWIRDAMSECGLFQPVTDRSPVRLELARTWVDGQAKWFFKKNKEKERSKKRLTICASVAAGVGLSAQVLGFIPTVESVAGKWPNTVAAIAALAGALIWSYIERLGFADDARQYARMYDLFSDASEDLKKFQDQGNLVEAERTLRELGCEALAETGDWLAMHRERKLPLRPGST